MLLSFFGVFLTACAISAPHYWPEKTSRVLELGTNKPLKDVIVMARWKGNAGLAGSQSWCYHVESTKTNENGQFTIPGFFEGFDDSFLRRRFVYLSFYTSDHLKAKNQSIGPYYKHNDYYLEKFTGSHKERFKFITTRGRGPSCNGAGESRRNSFVFHKAIYEEAKSLAKTKEEKKTVKWLRDILASSIDANVVSLTGETLEKRVGEILREQNILEQEK